MNALQKVATQNTHQIVKIAQDYTRNVDWSKAGAVAGAAAIAVGEIVLPIAAIGAAAYGAYKFVRWLVD